MNQPVIDTQSIQDAAEEIALLARDPTVYRAVVEVLGRRFGMTAARVDPNGFVAPGSFVLDESTYQVHHVRHAMARGRVTENELARVRNPHGTLWPLQRKIADAKFDFIKHLIDSGQQAIEPLKATVEVQVFTATVDVGIGPVPPRAEGQYYYQSYTLGQSVLD